MTLTEAKKKALDEELFSVRTIDRNIAIRRLELQTKTEHDENIGGGRGSNVSNPTERLVVKYSADRRIIYLEQLKSDIERFKASLTSEQEDIFNLRWGDDYNTWEEIGDKLFCSRKTIYRKRDRLLEKYAEIKGEI